MKPDVLNENIEIKRGEVYLAYIKGIFDQKSCKLPVLILQNDDGNKHSSTTIVAPLICSDVKRNLPVHVVVSNKNLRADSIVLLEQIQVIDKRRLRKKICKLNDKEIQKINKAAAISLALENVGGFENE